MENGPEIFCCLCQEKLIEKKVSFQYMNHTFYSDVPACPVCGQVFLSESLVRGKVTEMEMELEEK